MSTKILAASATAIVFSSGVAAAEDKPNSINVSPLGLAFGSYGLTYERLTPGGHGFLVEGSLNRSSAKSASQNSGMVAVGYRWHWSGEQDSGFLGINVGYGRGVASGSAVTDMTTTKSFDVNTRVLATTANIGRRWAFDNGLNITFRVGLGYGKYKFTTDSQDPDAKKATKAVDDLLNVFPIAIDGELSLGYMF